MCALWHAAKMQHHSQLAITTVSLLHETCVVYACSQLLLCCGLQGCLFDLAPVFLIQDQAGVLSCTYSRLQGSISVQVMRATLAVITLETAGIMLYMICMSLYLYIIATS